MIEQFLIPATGPKFPSAEKAVESLLGSMGYDTSDQHFEGTPARVAEYFQEWQAPTYPIEEILATGWEEPHKELVLVKHIPFVSLCAHHLLPFTGTASVGYLPGGNGRIVGLSKLARALYYHSHRATLQERIGHNLVEDIMRILEPRGAMVILEAVHECMTIRGVEARGAVTVTSSARGCFKEDEGGCKTEFLTLCR